ncbi:MAG: hypothetical protein ACT4PO_13850 [Actinomycetota bacterium]
MRRFAAVLVVVVLALAACGGGKSRSFDRYYDPQALFATDLPRGNDVTVATSQEPSPDGPAILAGVVSAPPQPSPAATTGFLGGGLAQQTPTDQTVYEMFVVTTDSFTDVRDMVLMFLTSDPNVDVREDQAVQIDGVPGRLVVADVLDGVEAQSSLAAAFTLGEDGTGFVVAALFPPGEWDAERSDFFKVLASFKRHVPPGIRAAPLAGGSG